MELVTITQVSNDFDISTRTLRYYEELSLIESTRSNDYAYRMYDTKNIKIIFQIVFLKKLNLTLNEIKKILSDDETCDSINLFYDKVNSINIEIEALESIKYALQLLINKLKVHNIKRINSDIFTEGFISNFTHSLSQNKTNEEERNVMNEVNDASKKLSKMDGIRVIYLPPFTVASIQYVGKDPEDYTGEILDSFIENNKLWEKKPDLRVFGFNNPSNTDNSEHGYEFWVTIPEDFQVDLPLVKKTFPGGMYAAYCIKMGDFHKWGEFAQALQSSDVMEYEEREPKGMEGSLEEHINPYLYYTSDKKVREYTQLDLLIPIKLINKSN